MSEQFRVQWQPFDFRQLNMTTRESNPWEWVKKPILELEGRSSQGGVKRRAERLGQAQIVSGPILTPHSWLLTSALREANFRLMRSDSPCSRKSYS